MARGDLPVGGSPPARTPGRSALRAPGGPLRRGGQLGRVPGHGAPAGDRPSPQLPPLPAAGQGGLACSPSRETWPGGSTSSPPSWGAWRSPSAGCWHCSSPRAGAACIAAAVCAVAVGAMPRLWTLAVEAEVFTLHLALVLGFWIALVCWRAAPPAQRGRWLLLAGLLAGLGLANHRTFLFFAAGGGLTVLLSPGRWPTLRQALLVGALFLAGLTPYLYVLRGLLLPVAYFAPTDVRRLTRGEVWYVLQGNASGETGGGAIVAALLRDTPLLLDRSRWLGGHVAGQFGPLGALAGPAGRCRAGHCLAPAPGVDLRGPPRRPGRGPVRDGLRQVPGRRPLPAPPAHPPGPRPGHARRRWPDPG